MTAQKIPAPLPARDGNGPDGQPRPYATWLLMPGPRDPFYQCRYCGNARTTTARHMLCNCARARVEALIQEEAEGG